MARSCSEYQTNPPSFLLLLRLLFGFIINSHLVRSATVHRASGVILSRGRRAHCTAVFVPLKPGHQRHKPPPPPAIPPSSSSSSRSYTLLAIASLHVQCMNPRWWWWCSRLVAVSLLILNITTTTTIAFWCCWPVAITAYCTTSDE